LVVAPPLVVAHDARETPAVHPQAEPPIGVPSDLPAFDGFRVLVVDDEAEARMLIERILRRCNVQVTTAQSADEAMELLRVERPNFLLSDIGMPGEDGYGLLRRVRALPPEQGGDTPAVAITAFAPSEGRRRALMAGFQMHVPKPVEPAELIAIVTSHFNAQRRTGMTKGG
jgi:CheY-like chemotaxis protein